jgi:hypothetical protein
MGEDRTAPEGMPEPGGQGVAPGGALGQWYDRAGVRSGIRRMFRDESDQGKIFFPDELVPYLRHEAVRALPQERRRELTVRHLYQFLMSTTHLETRVVNAGAERIANGRSGVELPLAARMDAFKIYCDEGYHALYSLDMVDQIAAVTGIAVPDWDYGTFVARLEATARRLLPDEPIIAQLLQVVVFETLITAVLNELPGNPAVVTTVRELMRDHAKDEGRHHRFFAAFFHQLWTGLDAPLRPRVAAAIPALIRDCLTWDLEPARRSLSLAGLDRDASHAVIADCYGGHAGEQWIREVAVATVRTCESAGVFEVPGAREAFAAAGLVD